MAKRKQKGRGAELGAQKAQSGSCLLRHTCGTHGLGRYSQSIISAASQSHGRQRLNLTWTDVNCVCSCDGPKAVPSPHMTFARQ